MLQSTKAPTVKKNNLISDFVAIDTNVFEHLFNPQKNIRNHIGSLLTRLGSDGVKLIGDTEGRIAHEYENRLGYFFSIQDGFGNITHQDYIDILRYWLLPETIKKKISVNQGDNLMKAIKKIVNSGNGTDRIFVYTAITADRILVTNDRQDIIDSGNRRGIRRQKLLKLAKQSSKKHARILTSEEAYDQV